MSDSEKNAALAADGICAFCKKPFPANQLITIRDCAICPECKPLALQQILEGVIPEISTEAQRIGPAWEERHTLGLFKAIWRTIKAVILQPQATFSTMKRKGGLLNPWLFYFILNATEMSVLSFYFYALKWNFLRLVSHSSNSSDNSIYEVIFRHLGVPLGLTVIVVKKLLWITLFSFMVPGMLHFFLRLADGVRQPFETTFRVHCYTAAVCVFALAPFVGSYLGVIAATIFLIIGLAKAHEISIAKSVWAVLISTFCYFCIGGVITFFFNIFLRQL